MTTSTGARYSWMVGLLSDTAVDIIDPQQRALNWLRQQGVHADSLTPLSGYTNHVFLVQQSVATYPQRSVLRLADLSLSADLCPLAHQFDAVLQRHIAAAELGLSPELMAAEREAGVMWLAYVGECKSLVPGDFAALRGMLAELYSSGEDWGSGGQAPPLQALLQQLLVRANGKHSSLPSPVGEGLGMGGRSWHTVQNQCLTERFLPPSPTLTPTEGGREASASLNELVNVLLHQAQQRGYFDYPLVPIHGDLNPGNLLHDGERWWLIDWDFSGMQCREWDLAGLVVEHGWTVEQAQAFAPEIACADIKWFCSCFTLLSWHWHVQRGSEQRVIRQKAETMHYWITLRG